MFADWNNGELSSFLITVAFKVFKRIDAETGQPLVDFILDKAGQKGTGKWTSQNAHDLGAAIPTITTAVVSFAPSCSTTSPAPIAAVRICQTC